MCVARRKSTSCFFLSIALLGLALRQHGFEPQEDTQQGEKPDRSFGTGSVFVLSVCVFVYLWVGSAKDKSMQGPAGRCAEETPAEALAQKRRKVRALEKCTGSVFFWGGRPRKRVGRWRTETLRRQLWSNATLGPQR